MDDEILEMNKLLAHKFLVDSVHEHGPFRTQRKNAQFAFNNVSEGCVNAAKAASTYS
jgi:hypothetical protein